MSPRQTFWRKSYFFSTSNYTPPTTYIVMILGNILALAALTSSALAAPTSQTAASSRVIPGSYIITLKDNVEAPAMQAHINWVGAVHKRSINKRDTTGVAIEYAGTFKGYAGSFDEDTIAQIRDHPDVRTTAQSIFGTRRLTKLSGRQR